MIALIQKRTLLYLSILTVISISILNGLSAYGAESGGSGLSVSPTRTELSIDPGESEKLVISVRNITKGAIIAKPFVNDFEADNDTGAPKLYKDTNQRNKSSISSFVKGLADVTLNPGETKELTYTINIPTDASPGAYYGAFTYRAVPADQATPTPGQVALTANVSSLVLIEVPGNITELLHIPAIKVYKNDKPSSVFLSAPNKIGITINNQGNSFAKPFGSVNVTDMFGKQVYSYEVNNATPRGNVLPNSTRIFKDDLKNVSKPGRYTVVANISYGSGGDILIQKSSFWYLPTWLVLTIVALLLIIAVLSRWLYMKKFSQKHFNKHR